jgi:hypothetical protein
MGDLLENASIDLVAETIDQLTGRSHKKWAVMLLAFVLGAAVAAWLIRKQLATRGSSVSEAASDAAAAVSDTVSDATA